MENTRTIQQASSFPFINTFIFPQNKIPRRNFDTRIRYSDPELRVFREFIEAKLEETIVKCALLKENNIPCKDTAALEEECDKITRQQQLTELMGLIAQFKQALSQIENKTYGICVISGKLITKDRLRRAPCIDSNYDDPSEIPY